MADSLTSFRSVEHAAQTTRPRPRRSATEPVLPALRSPSVSIVICNFNYAQYLEEAIASAVAQTQRCQVIVVDDGSTDGSREVLNRLSGDAARVLVVLQENGGQPAAYNEGLQHCTGDIVIFLDADDALAPDAVQEVQDRFTEGVVKVQFRLMLIDSAGHPIGASTPSILSSGDVRQRLVKHGLLYSSPPGSGNAYRRSALLQVFPIPVDSADRVGADFFAIYGVVAFGQVASCEQVLGRYRLHARAANGPGEELVFGNAALGNDEANKVAARYAKLRALLLTKTEGRVVYAERLLDFSVQKGSFATTVLGRPRWRAMFRSFDVLWPLLKAIWLNPDQQARRSIGLSAWALLVMVAPRRTGLRLARFVCDPASRAP